MIGFKMWIKVAVGVVVAIVLLAVSCPDEDSFNRWAKKALVSQSGSGLEKAKGKALATQANWTADYRGHVLWATVDAYQGGTERRYVGLVGTWFQIAGE